MPESQTAAAEPVTPTGPEAVTPARTVAEVNDLTWTGRPEAAIARATLALDAGGLSPVQQAELLELRAENLIARGEMQRCADDVKALLALAEHERSDALLSMAKRREAFLLIRRGDGAVAMPAARAALAAAERSGRADLVALALTMLAFASSMARVDIEAAPALARRAVSICERLGPKVFLGRAWLVLANVHVGLEQPREANQASSRALALARECGDLSGQAQALNLLAWFEADQSKVLKMRQQSLAANTAAGNIHGQAIIIGNLGSQWVGMGLFRRARRVLLQAEAMHRRIGNLSALAINFSNLFETELRLGHLAAARAAAEGSNTGARLGLKRSAGYESGARGSGAGRRACCRSRAVGRACLQGEARATTPLCRVLAMPPTPICAPVRPRMRWRRRAKRSRCTAPRTWRRSTDGSARAVVAHSQALRANGRAAEADAALAQAYRFLCQGCRGGRRRPAPQRTQQEGRDPRLARGLAGPHALRMPQAAREAHLAGSATCASLSSAWWKPACA